MKHSPPTNCCVAANVRVRSASMDKRSGHNRRRKFARGRSEFEFFSHLVVTATHVTKPYVGTERW